MQIKTGIMVAPNGARLGYNEHKAFPLTEDEIVQTAYNCMLNGANAIHLHIRDENFKHLLNASKYRKTINAIKKKCGNDFLIQTTTECVGIYKPNDIINLIYELNPEATSVAIRELIPCNNEKDELKNAKKFYKYTKKNNIGVQHIIYDITDLNKFIILLEDGIIEGDKHSLLYVLGRYTNNQEYSPSDILEFLEVLKKFELENKVHWMVCAFGQNEIPTLMASALLGGHNRIGFENSRKQVNNNSAINNESQVSYLKAQHKAMNIGNVNINDMKNILGIFQ